jgi:hypothetical protein
MVTPATVYDYHPAEPAETRKVRNPSGYDAGQYITER